MRNGGISFREVCKRLSVTEENEGWCAGLDAEYMYEAWQSLAGGSAIDERRKELEALTPAPAPAVASGSSAVISSGYLDEEESPGLHGRGDGQPYDPFDDDDDDPYF